MPSRGAAGDSDCVCSGHRLAGYLRHLRACREECAAIYDLNDSGRALRTTGSWDNSGPLVQILDRVDAWSDEHAGGLPKSVELLDPETQGSRYLSLFPLGEPISHLAQHGRKVNFCI